MTSPTDAAFRCSAASLTAAEPLDGTASTVSSFLLLENPGPWGVHALGGDRLDPALRRWLGDVAAAGTRPLLVRRPAGGSRRRSTTRVFVADAVEGTLRSAALEDPRELLDLDARRPGGPGFAPHPGSLFCVCTHGRHDTCCAELGRPLAAALAEAAPEQTWEVSHIGGDRFAPNVLVLPHGLYYGRLLPAEARRLVELHAQGRLDLDHLRGRSVHPFAVQAAETHLRRHLGSDSVTPLPLVSRARDGEISTAVFDVDGERWRVQVRTTRAVPARLTCRGPEESVALRHDLVTIARI